MEYPVISVIMPVYNGEKYLRQAIESILSQSFADFEFIIINDGSVDSTEEIILSYRDSRIVYVKNEVNLRLIKTLNKGVGIARGEFIARMDADDVSLPIRFERQIEYLQGDKCDIVSSSVVKIDESGSCIGVSECLGANDEESRFLLAVSNPVSHPAVMIRTELLGRLLYSDSKNAEHVEDYDLWARCIEGNVGRICLIGEPLLLYRRTGENITELHLNALLGKTEEIAKRIHNSVFEKVASRAFFSVFVQRTAPNGIKSVVESVTELRKLLQLYQKAHLTVDVRLLQQWNDYKIIQSILRLNRSLFFRFACLALYLPTTLNVVFRLFVLNRTGRDIVQKGLLKNSESEHIPMASFK